MEFQEQLVGILFADVVGYSKLQSGQIKIYIKELLPKIANKVREQEVSPLNTWGDGIMAASGNPMAIARLALAIRDVFLQANFTEMGFHSELAIRIALHAATVLIGTNPITGRSDIFGKEVNTAARIEPVVKANHICVTDEFHQIISRDTKEPVRFTPIPGQVPLAKGWGSEKLFDLRRSNEASFIPDYSVKLDEAARVNPRYSSDLAAVDRLWKLDAIFSKKTVCVVTNDTAIGELLDRPAAAIIRDAIDKRGGGKPFLRSFVCGAACWRGKIKEMGLPTIAVGGGVKDSPAEEIIIWAKEQGKLPFDVDKNPKLKAVFVERLGVPYAAVWGGLAAETRLCAERYSERQEGLGIFLAKAWT